MSLAATTQALHHALEPAAYFRHRLMQFAQQLDSNGRQYRAHPLLHRQPQYFEIALARLAATVGETEEVECLPPSQPTPLSSA